MSQPDMLRCLPNYVLHSRHVLRYLYHDHDFALGLALFLFAANLNQFMHLYNVWDLIFFWGETARPNGH